MKYNIHLISDAESDLPDIYTCIYVNDSEENAGRVFSGLSEKYQSLCEFASRGHKVPELTRIGVHDFLEISYKPYRIIYQIFESNVYIHCILDGRREIQDLLRERLMR